MNDYLVYKNESQEFYRLKEPTKTSNKYKMFAFGKTFYGETIGELMEKFKDSKP